MYLPIVNGFELQIPDEKMNKFIELLHQGEFKIIYEKLSMVEGVSEVPTKYKECAKCKTKWLGEIERCPTCQEV